MRYRVRLDVDDNASMWAATRPERDPLPPLSGTTSADVVILGAGFTGISTAYHLSRRYPDLRIVVLEARRVGNGASGRNGGMALNWISSGDTSDPERARRVFSVTRAGIDWFEQVIREHGLQVRFHRRGCVEAYTDARRAAAAHARAERLAGWGLPIRYLEGAELRALVDARGVAGALFDPTAAHLHGLDLLEGLCGVLAGTGVTVHEHCPALEIETGPRHTVTTPTGTVTAPVLVLATNGYTPRLGWFSDRVFPMHSHAIATEPLSRARWRELGWGDVSGFTDDLDRIAYASMTEDGRLLFGGGGNDAYGYRWANGCSWPPSQTGFTFVREVLSRYFPGSAAVPLAQRWTGVLGMTLSRTCKMGVTGPHRNVLYALGYSGHGVVLANLAGRVLCDLYADHPDPWRDLPFIQRSLAYVPPEPLRYVGYHLYSRLTGRSPRG